jgi:hypothetical protein
VLPVEALYFEDRRVFIVRGGNEAMWLSRKEFWDDFQERCAAG